MCMVKRVKNDESMFIGGVYLNSNRNQESSPSNP